ncbi:zinc-dependent peptidase [Flavobacterium palustre]|uniref:zinc-dependent peptidase n=1 Tax=Flavobacterium palustre TaxID=1476463 RepID=UPI0016675BD5|nr:zinc-dependent peptidase [Flavobacterium palustre]
MELNTVFQFLVVLIFGILALLLIVFRIVEPIYVLAFKKPLFLHVYPFSKKLNDEQKEILKNNFPFYNRLTPKKKSYFEHRVKEFIRKYEFVGKDIAITEAMQILIAGTYVMLTFGLRKYLIGLFTRIIIYPSSYYSSSNDAYHKGEFNPRMKSVVFSWEDYVLGHQTANDNLNLGLHEFAHALHFHCMKSNDSSAAVFYDEFNKITRYYNDEELNAQLRSKGYFRLYAYQNQFEFLAVILEHFFETPEKFKKQHPELYHNVCVMINFK